MKKPAVIQKEPSRLDTLVTIYKAFDAAMGWTPSLNSDFGYNVIYLRYIASIQALIELLEVHDCGSVGGFDGENSGLDITRRFEWLVKKYNNMGQVEREANGKTSWNHIKGRIVDIRQAAKC